VKRVGIALIAVTCGIIVGVLVLINRDQEPPVPGIDRPLQLQLQWFDQAQFAGLYVAQEKGFFRDEGIEVELISGSFNVNPIQRVLNGDADIALATGDQVLLAAANAEEIRAIGSVFRTSLAAFMSHDSAGIVDPEDIQGKVVGVYNGFDTENILLSIMNVYNMSRDSVDVVAAGPLQAFLSGDIDVFPVYVINEPVRMAMEGVPVRLLHPEALGIRYVSDTFFLREQFLNEYRPTVIKVLKAAHRGWMYAMEHPDEATNLMFSAADNLSEDERAFQRQMLKVSLEYLNTSEPPFALDRAQWMEMERSLFAIGKLDQRGLVDRICDFALSEEVAADARE
jgi:NitT/TauT family transport system substrate-binding protein